jgi:hypothetical protein
MRKKSILIFCVIVLLLIAGSFFLFFRRSMTTKTSPSDIFSMTTSTQPLPTQALLNNGYYVHQTFNNCGEAAYSMALSFYGVHMGQQALADILRPDNNTTGAGDDKSTTPDEIATQAATYGLAAYFRPDGNIDLLKRFVAAGFPVMTRTLLNTSEDYAHYRVVIGYDDTSSTIIDEDGIQGNHAAFSYDDFMTLWKPFNYEYIVFAAPGQQAEVEAILGADSDAAAAWRGAAEAATTALAANPTDTVAEFDLSVADYYIGDYRASTQAFKSAESTLSPHALWYQIEPIASYYETGNYSEVFSLAQQIIAAGNAAYPELYVIEGESYLKQNNATSAKQAFQTALMYNKNLSSAQTALAALSGQ